MTTVANIDKILARAAKLMAVQEGRGATEAEAANAAEHLQRLIQEHNLTLSQVEQHGGDSSVPAANRVKETTTTSIYQPWRAELLNGVARNNFCITSNRTEFLDKGRRQYAMLVGREVNVNVTKMTYEYLSDAFTRVCKELYGVRKVSNRRDWSYFMDGAVGRVIERLNERRREAEAASQRTPTTGNGTHQELVLSDVYGSEDDLNNDMLNGYPAGTTATKRRESAERQARQEAERDRLVAEGMDSTRAWYKSHGYSDELVESIVKQSNTHRRGSAHRHNTTGWSRRDEAEHRKISSAAYKSGYATGSSVGLDTQVGGGNPRRIK